MRLRCLFIAAAFAATASPVLAITCVGVETRVNVRTSALSTAVSTVIAARTEALVLQEVMQRQRLLSAIRVMTKQQSVAGEQEATAQTAAQKALSNVVVEQSVNRQMRDAVEEYGTTGHAACALVESGYEVKSKREAYSAARNEIAERVRENRTASSEQEFREKMATWNATVQDADDVTVQDVLNGDEDKAEAFIALVAGPPRPPIEAGANTVAARLDRIPAMMSEARNSAAVLVLAEIAESQEVRASLQQMSDQWTEDGGQTWATKMATSPTRGVLLDTARIEAQNIAMEALSVRQALMEEFALATFALGYVDQIRSGRGPADAAQ
tara:strand:+ start:8664 stop:9644 length:981 start_codon:yes stop_codon:yes gene_type:complete